ncbi:ATPase/protein kinase [Bacteroidia bacterium]|nr:ATPase/protein kinase [Bacteroidia bacterium]
MMNSALSVNAGVEQPPQVNPNAAFLRRQHKLQPLSLDEYVSGILAGNRTVLGRAITLVESARPEHQHLAQKIIEQCLPHTGNSIRLGITGVPGVGKSSFIEAIGGYVIGLGNRLAVLAIDPSSERSKGSILGDKTRMETLSSHPDAFIRPSPSAGSLGGVARKTRESIVLCEAAGFNVIFIETVGVGQSETQAHAMVDCFLLLMLAGAGDELQGIKRGIMELADILAITKSDGANKDKAIAAKIQYQSALQLFPPHASGWKPVSLACSSTEKIGLTEIWKNVLDYIALTRANGYFASHRNEQAKCSMHEFIHQMLHNRFYLNPTIEQALPAIEEDILQKKISAYAGAKKIFELWNQLPTQ